MSSVPAFRKWWIIGFVAAAFAMRVFAADEIEERPPLEVSLVSELTRIEPGKAFAAGIFLQHAPHHHSYYKFPGIVGVPTNITWELPPGWTAGPLQWPTPEQVDMRGHGAYGYHEDTLLLAEITAPEGLAVGKKVRLAGRVGYMCCSQEGCTPGFEDVELELTVGEVPLPDPQWQNRFVKVRSELPRALKGWHAKVEVTETHFQLMLHPPAPLLEEARMPASKDLYFFSWNGWTASNEPHLCQWKNDHYVFTMPKHPYPDADATRFQGVVKSASGWPGEEKGMKGLWIDASLPEELEK